MVYGSGTFVATPLPRVTTGSYDTNSTLPVTVGKDCMENTYVHFRPELVFDTAPIEYASNMPVEILVKTHVRFGHMSAPAYGGSPILDETIYVETFIDRLALGVN